MFSVLHVDQLSWDYGHRDVAFQLASTAASRSLWDWDWDEPTSNQTTEGVQGASNTTKGTAVKGGASVGVHVLDWGPEKGGKSKPAGYLTFLYCLIQ